MQNVEYSKIFIPKKVTVIFRDDLDAYMCDSENPNTMKTAKLWANHYKSLTDKNVEQMTYNNEGFRLEIKSAAANSSVGGKLSFWKCEVTAPDNRKFTIGVNAESICELIQYSCFINGKCQEDVKFGTKNNQFGFYVESMPAYKEFIKSQNLRDQMATKNTTKYKPGDIVRSLTESKLYIGEMYQYFDIMDANAYLPSWKSLDISDTKIRFYKTPKKIYVFAVSYDGKKYEICIETGMLKKKPKRLLTGATADVETVKYEFFRELEQYRDNYLSNLVYWRPHALLDDLMYGDTPELTDFITNSVRDRVTECIRKLNQSRYTKGTITYEFE